MANEMIADGSHMRQTVEPDEIWPLAKLFLHWRYQTAQAINKEIDKRKGDNLLKHWLTLFKLEDILYQSHPTESNGYSGILIKLKGMAGASTFKYENIIDIFCNIFVLKSDVFEIDMHNRDYCTFPIGHKSELQNCICSEKNLHILGPRIFYDIFTYPSRKNCPVSSDPIPQEYLWPWLGPIIKEPMKKIHSRTVDDDITEITAFINAARSLGQNESSPLARMTYARYPRLSYPQLARLVEPHVERTPANATKQARRWLGLD